LNLKNIRIAKGLTQQQLADATCIDRALIARYENGTRKPPIEKLQLLADHLGVSVDCLLGREEEKKETLIETDERIEKGAEVLSKLNKQEWERLLGYAEALLQSRSEVPSLRE